ncbi:MAG: sigma-E factor negative regulatory protein [Gammaproteobacteria bacterium]|nr:sigma-E factor negative regulatory protein [Gammaproteobacteria bacterium]
MKEESGVRISEFLDGELSDKELDHLSRHIQQAENKKQLQRFARIGHALRAESDIYSSIDVSQAVANAIAKLPHEIPERSAQPQSAVLAMFSSNWFKPAIGATFAAVVAVFTVMLNQTVTGVADNPAIETLAQQQINNHKTINITQLAENAEEIDVDLAVREELNNYLVNHARSASGGNYQGMVPYVRAVAYEPDRKQK